MSSKNNTSPNVGYQFISPSDTQYNPKNVINDSFEDNGFDLDYYINSSDRPAIKIKSNRKRNFNQKYNKNYTIHALHLLSHNNKKGLVMNGSSSVNINNKSSLIKEGISKQDANTNLFNSRFRSEKYRAIKQERNRLRLLRKGALKRNLILQNIKNLRKINKFETAKNTLGMLSLLKKIVFISPQNKVQPLHTGHISNQSYLYNYNSFNQYKHTKSLNYINHILNHFFGTFFAIISKPLFWFNQNKLTIHLNYFIPKTPRNLKTRHIWKYNKASAVKGLDLNNELNLLINFLSKLLNLKVELKMNQMKYPYMDSHILAKFIALNTNKTAFNKIFWHMVNKAITTKTTITDWGFKLRKFKLNSLLPLSDQTQQTEFLTVPTFTNKRGEKKNILIHKTNPAILTGIKVQISGRLITQRVKPKKTINQYEVGGFKKTKNNIVDYALYTNKNKRGAYTVKVWTSSTIHSII